MGLNSNNYFMLFSLAESIELDLSLLEQNYHQLAKDNHPDRLASSDKASKLQAVNNISLINDAYQVLKDQGKRLQHLLDLQGFAVDRYQRQVPHQFLGQLMEWRELAHQAISDKKTEALAAVLQQIDLEITNLHSQSVKLVNNQDFVNAAICANKLIYLEKIHHDLDEHLYALSD